MWPRWCLENVWAARATAEARFAAPATAQHKGSPSNPRALPKLAATIPLRGRSISDKFTKSRCTTSSLEARNTYASPPVMPEPKFIPTEPRITATPPVMYSQPCWPRPSTTASAPLLRTANRSPALPAMNSWPEVAPYNTVLPARISPRRDAARARRYADRSAGQSFANVIIGLASKFEREACRQKGAETLSRGTMKFAADFRLQFVTLAAAAHEFAADPRPHAAVGVMNGLRFGFEAPESR